MGKYNWTIDNLEYKLDKLKVYKEKEKNEDKLELINADISFLENTIKEYYEEKAPKSSKLLSSYKHAKRNLEEVKFMWDDYEDFRRIASPLVSNFEDVYEIKNNSLSKNDLLTITYDFYKQLDSFFFGNFMRNFYRRNDHIAFHNVLRNGDYNGQTTPILSLNESYIEIVRNYKILDVFTTIHEYAHATSAVINPYHFYNNKEFLGEVDSLFMELVAADYLEKQFKDGEAKIAKIASYIDNYNASLDCTDMTRLFIYEKNNHNFSSNKELKNYAFSKCNIIGEELEEIISLINNNSYQYLTGYIIALEIYNLYKEDKEKALNTLKKLILLEGKNSEDYYKKVIKLGINPNLNLSKFNYEIKNDIKSLSKKRVLNK